MLVYNGSVKLLTTGFVDVCCCKMLQMRRNKFELTNFCRLNWRNWTGWLHWMETALIRFFPINLDPDLPPVKPQERRYVYRGKHSFRGGLEWAEDFYDMNVLGNKNPIHMAVMAVVGAEMAESWAIHAVEASPWHPISHGHMEGSSLSFAPSILGQDHKNPVQRQGGYTVSLKMQQKHLLVSHRHPDCWWAIDLQHLDVVFEFAYIFIILCLHNNMNMNIYEYLWIYIYHAMFGEWIRNIAQLWFPVFWSLFETYHKPVAFWTTQGGKWSKMRSFMKNCTRFCHVLPVKVNCALWKFTGPSTSGRFFGMKVPDNRDDQPAGWGDGVRVQCSTWCPLHQCLQHFPLPKG